METTFFQTSEKFWAFGWFFESHLHFINWTEFSVGEPRLGRTPDSAGFHPPVVAKMYSYDYGYEEDKL